MQEYPGVLHGLDERLKFWYMNIPVGKHAIEMCLLKKWAFRRSVLLTPLLQICQLMINVSNSFLLWMHVPHESAAQLGIGVLPSLTLVRGPFRYRCCAYAFKLSYGGWLSQSFHSLSIIILQFGIPEMSPFWKITYSLNDFARLGHTEYGILPPCPTQQPWLVLLQLQTQW